MPFMEVLRNIVVPIIIGLGAGTLVAIIGPLVNWGVEKKRKTREARETLLAQCRNIISTSGVKYFVSQPQYARIRPLIRKEVLDKIEENLFPVKGAHVTIQLGGRGSGVNNFDHLIYDELTRIERNWGLL